MFQQFDQIYKVADASIDLALGDLEGYSSGTKFGHNPEVDTNTDPEDLWEGGGEYAGQPLSFTPETVDVFSSDANDTAAGTGAQTVTFKGLKSETSTEYEYETVTMNGATPVTSTNTWWRVNRAWVATAGSGGGNAGVITIRSTTTTANVFTNVLAGYSQTLIACDTVPYQKTMVIKRLHMNLARASGAAGSALVSFRVREPSGVFRTRRLFELQTGSPIEHPEYAGLVIPALSDVKMRIENVSDNDSVFDGSFDYILVSDE